MVCKTMTPVFGKRIRVSRMNECCTPVTGACAEVVSDGFISLSLSSETESGPEIVVRKANGQLCVNEKQPDSFKRFTLEMEFCGVDPDLLSFMTNMNAYQDWAGDNAGAVAFEGTVDQKFGLEMWTGLSGSTCPTGGEEASGYIILPCVNAGVLGDIKVDGENAVTFSMTGSYTVGGNQWGTGAHDVVLNNGVADVLPSALDSKEHLLIIETGVAPPPAQCGCISA